VIAKHRAALRAYFAAAELSDDLAENLNVDVGAISLAVYLDDRLSGDDTSEWTAEEIAQAAVKREKAALYAVLTTAPTTIAGAIAVLDHVGQDNLLGEAWDGPYGESLLSAQGRGDGPISRAIGTFPGRLAATMRSLIGEARS
jgi:hypothetical protein